MSRPVAVAERLAGALPPPSGAVVMGTGIVSIGLALDGRETLSRALLAIAAVVWVVLAGGVAVLVLRLRPLLLDLARSPAALTGVAGTNVLGVRVEMLGEHALAAALLAIGLALWLLLVPWVLAHWRRPTVGVSFVLAVGTESLAALAPLLALAYGAVWLAVAAVVSLGLGLAFYLFVLASFDLRQLLVGHGDHWVSGGAVAISALACARAAEAAGGLRPLGAAAGALETASLGIWAAAAAWLPALVVAELASRRLAYDPRRWSTVFPLGMYAVCSFAVARVEAVPGLADFARVWIWVAFAVWLVVFAGLLRRFAALAREALAAPPAR